MALRCRRRRHWRHKMPLVTALDSRLQAIVPLWGGFIHLGGGFVLRQFVKLHAAFAAFAESSEDSALRPLKTAVKTICNGFNRCILRLKGVLYGALFEDWFCTETLTLGRDQHGFRSATSRPPPAPAHHHADIHRRG